MHLEDVRFIVGEEAGDFVVGFTAYDTDGESYAGVLTITVQQYTGDMDVLYIAARNGELALSAKDFEDFWRMSARRRAGVHLLRPAAPLCGRHAVYGNTSPPSGRTPSG